MTDIPDPHLIYEINSSVANFTNHVRKNVLSIVWFYCYLSYHITNMISSHDLSRPMSLFFEIKVCINTSVF